MSRWIGYFLSTIHTQLIFNQIAQSDLRNQLQFWEALEQFHEQKRLHFYPKIFSDAPVLNENWQQWKLATHQSKPNLSLVEIFMPIGFIVILISIVAFGQLRKINI